MIYKFLKNCIPGDMVIPAGSEPMCHSYHKVLQVNEDHVVVECGPKGSFKAKRHLNEIVIIRPYAPKHIRKELYEEFYGKDGYYPWPYDQTKTLDKLLKEIGEDKICSTFLKQWVAASAL